MKSNISYKNKSTKLAGSHVFMR